MTSSDRSTAPRPGRDSLLALAASMGLAVWLLAPRIRDPLSFDGLHSYLPMARRLLAEGVEFLRSPDSLTVAPIAFIYPALLGAGEMTVRWANVALFCFTIALAFHAARIAHSNRAGVLAAFLVAISPTLRPYIADVLTEPPFMFFLAAWIAAVAELARGGSRGWVALGAIALAFAALTRPAAASFAPAMAVLFAWRAWRSSAGERRIEQRLAAMHVIAFAICAAWIVRNALAFGFPAIATGAGAALWLGIDPLVYGYDPVYFGMSYDVGAVARDMSHLSLAGERILRGAALLELRDIPLPVLAEMLLRKTIAFVFVTSTQTAGEPVASWRAWRIVLAVFAAAAVTLQGRSRVVGSLAALVAYMLAVHALALYNHRYSVGAIDIPLTLLAAIGLAACWGDAARLGVTAIAATIGVAAGLAQLAHAGPGAPRVDRVPTELLWSREVAAIRDLRLENAVRTAPGTFALAPGAALEIAVTDAPKFHPWDYSMTTLELAVAPGAEHAGCGAMRLRYRKPDEARFAAGRVVRIPLEPDGRMRALTVGTTVPLAINHEGVLRIEFECAFPATLEMGTISIAAPRRAFVYHDRYLEQNPPAKEQR